MLWLDLLWLTRTYLSTVELSGIWYVKYSMEVESLMIWIENSSMPMVMTTSETMSSLMMSSLLSVLRKAPRRTLSTKCSLLPKPRKSSSIESTLITCRWSTLQKYSDYMPMPTWTLDRRSQLKWLILLSRPDLKTVQLEEERLVKKWYRISQRSTCRRFQLTTICWKFLNYWGNYKALRD